MWVDVMHAGIAATARLGLFQLEPDDVPLATSRIKESAALAPELALYMAYAFSDLQRRDVIRATDDMLAQDLGVRFFDLGLVGGTLGTARRFPFVPMLSQGWSLPDATRRGQPGLQDLRQQLHGDAVDG